MPPVEPSPMIAGGVKNNILASAMPAVRLEASLIIASDAKDGNYSKHNLMDYKNISMLQGDYIQLIDKYEFDYFLVTKKYPINTFLYYDDAYEMIYQENEVILYKKKDSI